MVIACSPRKDSNSQYLCLDFSSFRQHALLLFNAAVRKNIDPSCLFLLLSPGVQSIDLPFAWRPSSLQICPDVFQPPILADGAGPFLNSGGPIEQRTRQAFLIVAGRIDAWSPLSLPSPAQGLGLSFPFRYKLRRFHTACGHFAEWHRWYAIFSPSHV